MTTLATFLEQRWQEAEADALAASPGGWSFGSVESVAGGTLYDETRQIADVVYEQPEDHDGSIVRHLLSPEANANGAHIARNDPAHVLADIASKRAVLAFLEAVQDDMERLAPSPLNVVVLDRAARMFAAPYADHADFQEAWHV